jgi:hypothetical protein
MRRRRLYWLLATCLLISACTGGGGGSSATSAARTASPPIVSPSPFQSARTPGPVQKKPVWHLRGTPVQAVNCTNDRFREQFRKVSDYRPVTSVQELIVCRAPSRPWTAKIVDTLSPSESAFAVDMSWLSIPDGTIVAKGATASSPCLTYLDATDMFYFARTAKGIYWLENPRDQCGHLIGVRSTPAPSFGG